MSALLMTIVLFLAPAGPTLDGLTADQWAVRLGKGEKKEARLALYRAGDRAAPILIELLRHPNPGIRCDADLHLGLLGEAAHPALLRALDHDDPHVQSVALGHLPVTPRTLKALARILHDTEQPENRRVAAAYQLAGGAREAAVSESVARILRPSLADPIPKVRRAVLGALIRVAPVAEDTHAALMKALLAKDRFLLPTAMAGLAKSGRSSGAAIPALIAALADPDKGVRAGAVDCLKVFAPKAALPALTKALDDPESLISSKAVRALVACGADLTELWPRLAKGVNEGDEWFRLAVAEVLREAETIPPLAIPVLVGMLDGRKTMVRKAAAEALAVHAPADGVRAAKGSPQILGWMGPAAKSAVPELAVSVQELAGWRRKVVLRALAKIAPEDERVIAVAEAALSDPKTFNRTAAIRILAAAKRGMPLIVKRLADGHEVVRSAASHALLAFGDAGAKKLIEAMKTRPEFGRSAGLWSRLADLGPVAKAAIPLLVASLSDPEWDDRFRKSVTKYGPEAIAPLTAAISKKDPRTRLRAARLLGDFGAAAGSAVPALTALVASEEPELARTVLTSLGRIGPAAAKAVPALRKALASKEFWTRDAALRALAGIGPKAGAAVPELRKILTGPSEYLKWKAEEALAAIKPN